MNPKSKYVVVSSVEQPGLEWERSLQSSMGICHTFAKAYEIALFLAGITVPDIKYRKLLETAKRKGAATVKQKDGEQSATIVKVRIY
jgi:hypothetical protein